MVGLFIVPITGLGANISKSSEEGCEELLFFNNFQKTRG